MKKILLLPFLALLIVGIAAFTFFTPTNESGIKPSIVKSPSQSGYCAPYSNTPFIYDGCAPSPVGSGCLGVWKVFSHLGSYSIIGKNVHFNNIPFCHWPSITPPWASSTLLGVVAAPYRPQVTRVINATAADGSIVQCTIHPSGNWYIQHTGGTLGQGTNITGWYIL